MSLVVPVHESKGSDEYRVERRHGCMIIWGAVPIPDMVGLCQSADPDSLMDLDLASKMGAGHVIGTPENLELLRNDPNRPVCQKRTSQSSMADSNSYPTAFVEWLAHGDRGQSSDAIAEHVAGIRADEPSAYPHDASDFGRCLGVIETLSEHSSEADILSKMSEVSEPWNVLTLHWDELKELKSENNRKCSARMRELLDPIERW